VTKRHARRAEWNQRTVMENMTQLLHTLWKHSLRARGFFFLLNKMDQIQVPETEEEASAVEAPV